MTATIAPLPKCREAPACFNVPWAFEKVVLGPSLTNAKNGRYLTYDAVINSSRHSVAGQRSCILMSFTLPLLRLPYHDFAFATATTPPSRQEIPNNLLITATTQLSKNSSHWGKADSYHCA